MEEDNDKGILSIFFRDGLTNFFWKQSLEIRNSEAEPKVKVPHIKKTYMPTRQEGELPYYPIE